MEAIPTSTISINIEIDKKGESSDILLLQNWVNHSDISYHYFDDQTAFEIRTALLNWYRCNRRKLPWRGDPPPYDGSTAGINGKNNTIHNIKKSLSQSQSTSPSTKKISSFFPPVVSTRSKAATNATSNKTSMPQPDSAKSNCTTIDPAVANFKAIPVSAYGVWVSEVMLQQTRVEAVIPYWCKWMTTFPTVHHLANATDEQVNAHWAGLGFYRRARLLHQGAQYLVKKWEGNMPQTREELLDIPGIGPYTASAIASIAHGQQVPVVDGNVCRVLSRLCGIANHIKAPMLKDKKGWDLAEQLVQGNDSKFHAGELNQALMELGATYCAPSGTGCDPRDPLKDYYLSTRLAKAYHSELARGNVSIAAPDVCGCSVCDANGVGRVLELFRDRISLEMDVEDAMKVGHCVFPLDPPKGKKREEDLVVAAISNTHSGATRWLLIKRPEKGLLAGQWEFPSVCVQVRSSNDNNADSSVPPKVQSRRKALTQYLQDIMAASGSETHANSVHSLNRTTVNPSPLEHIFSHVRHIMWVEAASTSISLDTLEWVTSEGRVVRWMSETDMSKVGITSGIKKVLQAVKVQHKKQKQSVSGKRKR